jgi:carboxymethylenebutenolidase
MRSMLALTVATLGVASMAQAQARTTDYAQAMRRAHAHDAPVASPAALIPPQGEVIAEEVTYGTVNGKAIKGWLARPAKGPKNAPGIVVVHEWWGLNDNIKAMTKRLAGEGYQALAVDLMGGNVAATPDSATALYKAAMQDIPGGEKNLEAAIAYLKKAGAGKVGSVGWCFGGHWSLRTGLVGGANVQAVAIFYGAPITDPKELARLHAPILGSYGGLDQGIPVDSVKAMADQLTKMGKPMAYKVYPDANHGFANPSGRAYNQAAADDAWQRVTAFFKEKLK